MKKRQKLLIAILILMVVLVPVGLIYKQWEAKKNVEKCEAAKGEMVAIIEKHMEALSNQDYDAFIDLRAKDATGSFPDLDSMYEFLSDGMYDFGESIDYYDFTFSMLEITYCDFEHYYEKYGIERAVKEGMQIRVELGNSEKKYHQLWDYEFVLEDEKIKVDEVGFIWWPAATLVEETQ